ncbi:MAG: hypothetical protein RR720_23070 [Comamonas sp.]|uniref:hypothetical protein n=1 Tax=Comamonas sp. TaxID=34028 RepID=UPI002FC5D56F
MIDTHQCACEALLGFIQVCLGNALRRRGLRRRRAGKQGAKRSVRCRQDLVHRDKKLLQGERRGLTGGSAARSRDRVRPLCTIVPRIEAVLQPCNEFPESSGLSVNCFAHRSVVCCNSKSFPTRRLARVTGESRV